MAQSSDIMRYLDQLDGVPILDSYQASSQVEGWLSSLRTEAALLCYPRMLRLDLPELASDFARGYFQSSRQQILGMGFDEALARSREWVAKINLRLAELPGLVDIHGYLMGERSISVDDLCLFSELRNLSMVKELFWPMPVTAYLEKLSKVTSVSLYLQQNSIA